MQTINVLYGGEDTRSLSYQSEKPHCVKGDNNSTTLHFIFPEDYSSYQKKIVFDVKVPRVVYPDAQGFAVNGQAYQTATMTVLATDWVATEGGYTYTGAVTLTPGQYISEILQDPDLIITPAKFEGDNHNPMIYLHAKVMATEIIPTETTYEITLFAKAIPADTLILDCYIFGKTTIYTGDPEIRYVWAEYALDNNNDVSLPLELTTNANRMSSFKLVMYNPEFSYIESSRSLGLAFSRM